MALPNLTKAQVRSHAQLLAQDTDTTNPGLSADQWDSIVQSAHLLLAGGRKDRISMFGASAATLWAAGYIAASTPFGTTQALSFDLIEFKRAYNEDAATYSKKELEIISLGKLKALIEEDSTEGTPTHAAFIRNQRYSQDGNQTWYAWVWPIPTANFKLGAHVIGGIQEATNDADVLDLSLEEDYIVATLAAILASPLLGYDAEFENRLIRLLPEREQKMLSRIKEEQSS